MQPASVVPSQPQPNEHDAVFHAIEESVGQKNFDRWFKNRTSVAVHGEILVIGVASPFLQTWMQKHFRETTSVAAQVILGPAASTRFEVDASLVTPSESVAGSRHEDGPSERAEADGSRTSSSAQRTSAVTSGRNAGPRDNRRRFRDLSEMIEGDSNSLALMAARQVCASPGERFNPLYVHGGVGVGKTHLLEGIYRELRREFPSLNVLYLTSEAFANYFTIGLRDHTLPAFRQRFRNVDALLVDDVDFFNGKKVIQEEFLHTFKTLEQTGRQIVVTADRHPRLLNKTSEELTSRFASGMVCRVESPDLETRTRIVRHKAAKLTANVTASALGYIAERFRNNVRELEGALNCLETQYLIQKEQIGVATARRVLGELERDCVRIIHLTDIEAAVCKVFGVEAKELKSAKRSRTVSQPRMVAMYLARQHTGAAYTEIGDYFGGRNHSTVMSAERKVREWLGSSDSVTIAARPWQFGEVVEAIEQQLLAG